MAYFALILIVLLFIVLFLYVQLRKDVKEVARQLRYTRQEESSFQFFTSSSDKNMKMIIEEVNFMREENQQSKSSYLDHERQTQNMIANISHDIRTPLTSIQGYMEMMEQADAFHERQRYHHIVTNRLHDLETMLDEFFVYTKLMSTREELPLEPKALYPIVCKSLLNYIDLLKAHEIEPMVICADEGITAQVHEESLQRICMNLIINTIRYGTSPYRIEVKKEDHHAILIFQNRCSQDTLIDTEHMFDRFYKGDKARTQKGSGLGLAIVAETLQRLHGSVEALYEDNELSIRIQLPLIE